MKAVYTEIELTNCMDGLDARKGIIEEGKTRRTEVVMRVSQGVFTLAINENIQADLQLSFVEKRPVQLADGRIVDCDVVGPVDVKFANKMTLCNAYVLPGESEPVLGSIAMLGMNVLVDAEKRELVVNPKLPKL